jgi:hypothetical protein
MFFDYKGLSDIFMFMNRIKGDSLPPLPQCTESDPQYPDPEQHWPLNGPPVQVKPPFLEPQLPFSDAILEV